MFAYIRPVQCNVQMINDRKDPAKGFGLVIIKFPQKKYYYITLVIILYDTKPAKYNQ